MRDVAVQRREGKARGHEGKADGVCLRQCNQLRGKCELYSWDPEVEREIEPELN